MAEVTNSNVDFTSSKPIFSWKSPEFKSYKRDVRWLTTIILVAVILAVILVIQKQWTGVALVVVATVLFTTLLNTKPKEVGCAIYNEGVVVGGKVFNYAQFKSFWLVNGELPKIKLQLTGKFSGQITMPLGDNDPGQTQLFLSKHLAQEQVKTEDADDILNRLFRL